MRETSSLVVAYLVSEYRRITHTFIHREVAYLRREGVKVIPFTIRHEFDFEASPYLAGEPPPESLLDDPWFAYAWLPLKWLVQFPERFTASLALCFSLRQPGGKGLLYSLFYFTEATVLAEKCRRHHVTHLHNHFGDASGNVAAIAARLLDIPLSFTFHGSDLFKDVGRWHLDKKVNAAAFSVASSRYAQREVLAACRDKKTAHVGIIHCGVDPDEYVPHAHADTKNEFRFINVGRAIPGKGIPVLLDAFAIAQRKSPVLLNLDLVCAATPHEKAAVELEALRRNLKGLTLHFNLANPDVRALMNRANAVVCSSYAEGIPLVLIEAMALGRPVISTAVGGIPELVVPYENGLLVPAGDANELALAMLELATDPSLSFEMGINARRTTLERHDATVEARRLKDLFHAVA